MAHTLRIEVSDEHNPEATPLDGEYIVAFIRKALLPDEVYPTNTRYNPDCNCVEYTPDGGTTWEPNPSGDPRLTSPLPPQTGTNAACNSAASERKYLTRWHEVLQTVGGTGTTATGLGYGILALLLDLSGPWAIVFDVIVAAALGFIDAGLTAINTAFSDAHLDLIECIIYCHLNSNNQLDAGRLSSIQSDVSTLIGGTSATIINAVLALQGFGGINSAMALKLDTDDCSGCDACNWCYTWPGVNVPSWQFYPDAMWSGGARGQFSASKWTAVKRTSGAPVSVEVMMRILPSFATTITRIDVTFTKTAGTFNSAAQDIILKDSPNGYYNGTTVLAVNASGHAAGTWTWTGSTVVNAELTIWMFGSSYTSTGTDGALSITGITIHGTGSNPFGSNNC